MLVFVFYLRHIYDDFCHFRCYVRFDTANNVRNLVLNLENNGRQIESIILWPRTFQLMSLLVTYSHVASPIVLVNWFHDFGSIAALMDRMKPPTLMSIPQSPSNIQLSWIDENFFPRYFTKTLLYCDPLPMKSEILYSRVNRYKCQAFLFNLGTFIYFSFIYIF